MTILILAEHDGSALKAATYNTVMAASQISGEIHVAILSNGADSVVKEAASLRGVTKVIHLKGKALEYPLAEPASKALMTLAKSYSHILAPASTYGKNILPRVAALLDVMQISDVIKVHSTDTFDRPIYAGNAIVTVKSKDPIKVITVRPTAFDKAVTDGLAAVEVVDVTESQDQSKFVSLEASKSDRPELSSARIVVSGGRALASKENFKIIEELADTLKAAIGASRAAVDAGYVPNDYQVGQTGKVVAPELYIAVGISGAIQHLAGMKDSKTIIAINKDGDAPIFQIADYGLVGDLFEIVPQLTSALKG
ncbi:electron transfer flavoprotein subunit alpha/FixB family protein [Candidatus Odyssella acanthamoebae]|uniref:Electron transfer flavoprotein subunit alpha n=1 Tax=Candidatus Odyssella acanthamoebae TaxID=91604 RepID=A0A077AU57_9PROT|nr:FAD-binding protein [Candidatus Paracaedibacter acanthamoebae]AIK95539.1 electron transfer flavoprotein subunit beta [Candidatus Paracaedibacter acanthamoebae]